MRARTRAKHAGRTHTHKYYAPSQTFKVGHARSNAVAQNTLVNLSVLVEPRKCLRPRINSVKRLLQQLFVRRRQEGGSNLTEETLREGFEKRRDLCESMRFSCDILRR